jgi:hypothetical protein
MSINRAFETPCRSRRPISLPVCAALTPGVRVAARVRRRPAVKSQSPRFGEQLSSMRDGARQRRR